jgi:hypothetical protein
VGEKGIRTVGENSGQPVPVAGQPAVPYGIHTPMEPMEPARPSPPGDRLAAHAKPSQLGKGDDSMLTPGEVRKPRVERGFMRFVNSWLTNFRDPFPDAVPGTGHARTVPHCRPPVGYERYETITTPWWAATRSTMSPMMRLTSKSLGV